MSRPIRCAFADPPYPGQAWKHYRREEVDHRRLFDRLVRNYPDGWALSTSSAALQHVLGLAPPWVRVAAWVKPFAIWKQGVNPAYCWEPVIWAGGRSARDRGRSAPTVRDWVSANIMMKTGLAGSKPEAFCFWLFELLGLAPGDRLDDLYPGTRAVSRAWKTWQAQQRGTHDLRGIRTGLPGPAARHAVGRRDGTVPRTRLPGH